MDLVAEHEADVDAVPVAVDDQRGVVEPGVCEQQAELAVAAFVAGDVPGALCGGEAAQGTDGAKLMNVTEQGQTSARQDRAEV